MAIVDDNPFFGDRLDAKILFPPPTTRFVRVIPKTLFFELLGTGALSGASGRNGNFYPIANFVALHIYVYDVFFRFFKISQNINF